MSITRTAERVEFLSDILCAALEGGVGYWSQADDIDRADDPDSYIGWYYRGVTLFEGPGVVEDCQVTDVGECQGHRVTLDTIATALGKFKRGEVEHVHESYVRTIREADRENDGGEIDADLADMIVQVAALGSVIYG